MEPVRIVLLGSLGAGKSTTANMLLGMEEFPVNHSGTQANSNVQERWSVKNNWYVVDTPGLDQEEEMVDKVMTAITDILHKHTCIVVYVQADIRETDKGRRHIEALGKLIRSCKSILVIKCPLPYVKKTEELTEQEERSYMKFLEEGGKTANRMAGDSMTFPVVCGLSLPSHVDKSSASHPDRLVEVIKSQVENDSTNSSILFRSGQARRWCDLQEGSSDFEKFETESQEITQKLKGAKSARQWANLNRSIMPAAAMCLVGSAGTVCFAFLDASTFFLGAGPVTVAGARVSFEAGAAVGAALETFCRNQEMCMDKDIADIEKKKKGIDSSMNQAEEKAQAFEKIRPMLR
jgi:hypothetical protein